MRIAVLLFCFLLLNACQDNNEKDYSLNLKAYRAAGMPDPGKVWTSSDFYLAYAVLEDMKTKRPLCLPIKRSNKSGMVFDRMISRENLSFLHDDTLPVEHKLQMTRSFLRVCENWIKIYSNDEIEGYYYHEELTQSYLFALEIAEIMLDIYRPTPRPTEEDIEEDFGDENPIQPIYIAVLFRLLKFEEETIGFATDDHMQVAKMISTSLQKNKIWIGESAKNDLKVTLNKLKDQQKDQMLVNQYSAIIDSL